MTAQHTDDLECPCEPKQVTIHGCTIDLHRPLTGRGRVGRRNISGLPEGWVIVGRSPSAAVMTEAQRKSEAESIEAAALRRERNARKQAAMRRRRGIE